MNGSNALDVGDMVGISGYVRRTPRGELSIAAEKFDIISKSLQPLPEKFHGLTDVDARYRQRYVDFIMNEDSKEIYKKRCQITSAIRRWFEENGFLEVETPMLHPIMGGRQRQTVHYPSQFAGHGFVPAHCTGTLSEAFDRRRF